MSFGSDEDDYYFDDGGEEDTEWNIEEQEDQDIYKPEMGAFDRVGLPGAILGGIVGPDGKIDRTIQDPLERFQIQTDAIARNLMEQNINISENDIQIMLEKAVLLKYVNFKNANAYVTGYIASQGGIEISKESFNYTVKKVLPLLLEGSVQQPDVLRYARLYLNL